MAEYNLEERMELEIKLREILFHNYGPSHNIDILKECIKILQPYAEKEREKTNA